MSSCWCCSGCDGDLEMRSLIAAVEVPLGLGCTFDEREQFRIDVVAH